MLHAAKCYGLVSPRPVLNRSRNAPRGLAFAPVTQGSHTSARRGSLPTTWPCACSFGPSRASVIQTGVRLGIPMRTAHVLGPARPRWAPPGKTAEMITDRIVAEAAGPSVPASAAAAGPAFGRSDGFPNAGPISVPETALPALLLTVHEFVSGRVRTLARNRPRGPCRYRDARYDLTAESVPTARTSRSKVPRCPIARAEHHPPSRARATGQVPRSTVSGNGGVTVSYADCSSCRDINHESRCASSEWKWSRRGWSSP
jgi:hypothetical protein